MKPLIVFITALFAITAFAGETSYVIPGATPVVGAKAVICDKGVVTEAPCAKTVICDEPEFTGASKSICVEDAKNFSFTPQLIPDCEVDRLQWGFDLGTRWDSNLFLAPDGLEQDGFTYMFSPNVLYRVLGDRFTPHMVVAGYGANVAYRDFMDDASIGHDADLLYRFNSGRTTAKVQGRYTRTTDAGLNYGSFGDSLYLREEQRNFSDRFSVTTGITYRMTECVSLDFQYGFHDHSYDRLNDLFRHGGQVALYYGGQGLINFGPYVGYERIYTENNPDQEVFQVGGSAKWQYSEVTNFFAQAGWADTSYSGVGAVSDSSYMVWSAGMDWHPSVCTSGRLSFDRRISPSVALNNQTYVQSSIQAALRKQFLDCYFGRVVGTYAWTEYDANTVGGAASRDEDFVSSYFEVGRSLLDYGEVSLFYNYLSNEQDGAAQSREFSNDTVGMRVSADF